MGITMFLQQRLNPSPMTDPIQKNIYFFSFFYNYNISSICCWFNSLLDNDKYFNNNPTMDYS